MKKVCIGQVHWFDNQIQEGIIVVEGKGYLFCNPQPENKMTLKDFEFVKCELLIDITFTQISRILEISDEEKDEYVSNSLINRLDYIEEYDELLTPRQRTHLERILFKEMENNL